MGINKLNKKQVAKIIKNFINKNGAKWDWDDFISIPIEDKYLDSIRKRCAKLTEEFPPEQGKGYCNKEGIKVLQNYANDLSM